jgi:proteasome assembly chaperone (PAC2) family protein
MVSHNLLSLDKEIVKPDKPVYMIAGFNQWANAGDVSNGIPEYLIEKLEAKKIGQIHKDDFYLFQLPTSHYMFRPEVKYVDGYEEEYEESPVNDFYYAEVGDNGLVIFIGTEPIQHEDTYVNILLDGAAELGVKRIVVPSGVGGEVPFGRERRVSCSYSLKPMREDLKDLSVGFSNYDRNATIGMVINHYCKERKLESVCFTALTPNYESSLAVVFGDDKRAMYDILRRIRYMFGIELDLSALEKESKLQIAGFENALSKIYLDNPEVESQMTAYMERIEADFEELNFKEPTQIPDVFLKEFNI